MILVYFLLFLKFGGCTNQKIESKTVTAGGSVKLKCPRTTSANLLWIRVVPGNLPEFLGKSPDYKRDRFTTKAERETLVLLIEPLHVNDAGVYICMMPGGTPTFLKRTDLTVVESKDDNLTEVHPSGPNPGEHSVFLQCPVFSDSENATSLDGTNESCCGSGPARPFFHFLCKNVEADFKNSSWQNSRNSFFTNISSLENVCCSVAKCGDRPEPKNEVSVQNPDCQTDNTVLYVFSVVVLLGLIVTVLLIYLRTKLKTSLCGCCTAANFPLQRTAVKVNADHLKQQSDEEQELVYAVPTITLKTLMKSQDEEKDESIYTCVREHCREGLPEADL